MIKALHVLHSRNRHDRTLDSVCLVEILRAPLYHVLQLRSNEAIHMARALFQSREVSTMNTSHVQYITPVTLSRPEFPDLAADPRIDCSSQLPFASSSSTPSPQETSLEPKLLPRSRKTRTEESNGSISHKAENSPFESSANDQNRLSSVAYVLRQW